MEKIMKKSVPEPNTGCWLWFGTSIRVRNHEYGVMRINKRLKKSHRVSFEVFKSKIPDGLLVCHKCDTPLCVNPDHLFLGTNLDNNMDMIRKRRHHFHDRKECQRGHILSPENLVISKDGLVKRCRLCQRLAGKKHDIGRKQINGIRKRVKNV
jgi:hypothetical protein